MMIPESQKEEFIKKVYRALRELGLEIGESQILEVSLTNNRIDLNDSLAFTKEVEHTLSIKFKGTIVFFDYYEK